MCRKAIYNIILQKPNCQKPIHPKNNPKRSFQAVPSPQPSLFQVKLAVASAKVSYQKPSAAILSSYIFHHSSTVLSKKDSHQKWGAFT